MKETRILMGMPVTAEIIGGKRESLAAVFDYFTYVDEKFSTYRYGSEISRLNRGEIAETNRSADMREILSLSERTKDETKGYFDIRRPDNSLDPSGIVKGWAILNAAERIARLGFKNFYIDAGGDIEARGHTAEGRKWSVGIRDPFASPSENRIVKTLHVSDAGVATSGTYIRGDHIYDPVGRGELKTVVSLTVIGPNAYEADRFATAAFAMGEDGIMFIESLDGFEGYSIDVRGIATMTGGFNKFT